MVLCSLQTEEFTGIASIYSKDSSDSEHKLSSKVQRAYKGIENEGAKTNKSRQGREMKDRKNTK